MLSFTFYKQLNAMDCGPTCLRMIAKHYGKHFNADALRQIAGFSKEGVSMLGISEAAEKIGFRTRGVQLSYEQLTQQASLPAILHWNQNHFVVLISAKTLRKSYKDEVKIADPANGIICYTKDEFIKHWYSTHREDRKHTGTVLLLEPTAYFYEQTGEKEKKISWGLVFQYLRQCRWQLTQVGIALLVTSLFSLLFPFLTQSIVDTGINTQNLQYITIVLIAQLMLIFSRTIVEFIRSRLMLQISTTVNLSILSDFWIKLTRLPLSYFDTHHTGDTLQRIGDHKQIQNFLTGTALNTIFSIFNFIVFTIVLMMFSPLVFFVFIFGSGLYVLWVQLFLRFRRKLNHESFHISAKENNATLELVQGMQEIRLNNAEQLKRWNWENLQAGIFKLAFKKLTYAQVQQAGALFIHQGKDAVVTFLVAQLVIQGQLTLGTMLAVQYIIGQLSGPIEQFVGFVQSAQDAKISMERLNEVHQLEDEEKSDKQYLHHLPENKSIVISDLSFSYPGVGNDPVLENINLRIPAGKITAIVGVSGSGKTTLLKLLLKFYESYNGEIKIGNNHFNYFSHSFWRRQCGAVMQDGHIFNDTIARNIAVSDEIPNHERVMHSCKMANLLTFIETLPNNFNTKLGVEGVGISQGQKQRLLIARAIYKQPHYLFLDEASNALDANNEKAIVENLQDFFKGKTVVIVAHRLSTVKNADNIVVLHKGKIAEEGDHHQLSATKGRYYELVKNQLELGN
jgi:ATP-binding cassette subfamily B protein